MSASLGVRRTSTQEVDSAYGAAAIRTNRGTGASLTASLAGGKSVDRSKPDGATSLRTGGAGFTGAGVGASSTAGLITVCGDVCRALAACILSCSLDSFGGAAPDGSRDGAERASKLCRPVPWRSRSEVGEGVIAPWRSDSLEHCGKSAARCESVVARCPEKRPPRDTLKKRPRRAAARRGRACPSPWSTSALRADGSSPAHQPCPTAYGPATEHRPTPAAHVYVPACLRACASSCSFCWSSRSTAAGTSK